MGKLYRVHTAQVIKQELIRASVTARNKRVLHRGKSDNVSALL
jgi:hypothetical protein